MFELHIQYCCSKRQSVSSESQPEYNWSDIEEEVEKEMTSEELVLENMVSFENCDNNEGSDYEEAFTEDFLVEKSVTKPSVRTENISHKPMTRSSAKGVSEQQPSQSSVGSNLSSKTNTKQKTKPNSRVNRKLFPFECGFNGCNAVFSKRKSMVAHTKKLHQWKCDFPGCDYQTQYQYRKLHLRRHSSPLQCDYCHKNYKYKWALIEHIKTQHWNQYNRTKSLRH